MKYIKQYKIFESDSYYKLIPGGLNEIGELINKHGISDFNNRELSLLRSLFKNPKIHKANGRVFGTDKYQFIDVAIFTTHLSRIPTQIIKLGDEYYVIVYNPDPTVFAYSSVDLQIGFYLCDGKDGLEKFIKDSGLSTKHLFPTSESVENKETLYRKIDYNEYIGIKVKLYEDYSNPSELEISKIENKLKEMSLDIFNQKGIIRTDSKKVILNIKFNKLSWDSMIVRKSYDDYYYADLGLEFYECDTVDGLLQLIDDIYTKSNKL